MFLCIGTNSTLNPLVLINVIATLYQVVDMFWVAKLGTESIAGISVSFPIIFVVNSIMFELVVQEQLL